MPTNEHGDCPHCGADMNGGSIWQTFRDRYGTDRAADETAALYGATRDVGKWGRAIAIYDMEKDRTVEYECPDCGERWPRFF